MYYLVQTNIARWHNHLEESVIEEFNSQIDAVNKHAEVNDGFIWRYESNDNGMEVKGAFGDKIVFNMSIWDSLESLRNFSYKGQHSELMNNKQRWFMKLNQATACLWWIPKTEIDEGSYPSVATAKQKLDQVDQYGPSRAAFTFANFYSMPVTNGTR